MSELDPRVAELAVEWERTRSGVLSPGLYKAVDDLRAIGYAIKVDNDEVDREDYRAHLEAAEPTPPGFCAKPEWSSEGPRGGRAIRETGLTGEGPS